MFRCNECHVFFLRNYPVWFFLRKPFCSETCARIHLEALLIPCR